MSVEIAGVEFPNPIILASCGTGWDGEHLKECGLAGAGGVVPKTLAPKQIEHPRVGRMGLVRHGKKVIGMINLELFSTLPFERWLDRDLEIAAEGGVPIVASVLSDPDPSFTNEVVRKVSETGFVSMIELNMSCPMPVEETGMHISRSPDLIKEQVKASKEASDLPVCAKLSPNYAYIDELAEAAEDANADAIVTANTLQGLHGVDIESGKLTLPAFGGYSGPAIKPVNLKCTAQAAKTIDIPIFGVGGISTWRDVVEYIMVGATAVQIGTVVMNEGLEVFSEFNDKIESFMDEKGYDEIEDMRGIALENLSSAEELAELEPLHAEVDRETCTGCERCIEVCPFEAMELTDGKAESDPERCDGCRLCVAWCPVDAIRLDDRKGATGDP
ncbi:hypothetical protein AKJ66_03410 [candidate division MSBL1 archaeon SCGC-AAA259E22]|uniref:Dihydroorotate dehydrogenase B (NAD(+)), catalytic subunit n=1 Tax=candidate division MSBL1 archaeon SCGC-AAA259E22 TaxID=1698265 RepID=A0A133UF69_9EURY|nr:hypothetical protein AKJ66_03410 [candidate division MSBL1 archaeon SCGC-AAA259E22]